MEKSTQLHVPDQMGELQKRPMNTVEQDGESENTSLLALPSPFASHFPGFFLSHSVIPSVHLLCLHLDFRHGCPVVQTAAAH